jgi:hypothetical protein
LPPLRAASIGTGLGHLQSDPLTTALANLFFFSALLPFLAPMPAPSDVQWPAFLIAVLIVALDLQKRRFSVSWVEYVFLAIGVWSLCFVLPGDPFNGRARIGILMSFLAYYVVRKHAPRFSMGMLMAAIAVTLVASIVQLRWPSSIRPLLRTSSGQ